MGATSGVVAVYPTAPALLGLRSRGHNVAAPDLVQCVPNRGQSLLPISKQLLLMKRDATGQSDQSYSPIKEPASQVTLGCVIWE